MQYIRVWTDDDGETHLEDVDVDLTERQSSVSKSVSALSAVWPVEGLLFRHVVAEDTTGQPHNAPRRQFVVQLVGDSEVEVSDGSVRKIGPGSVVLVEDTTGWGHITRAIGPGPRQTLFITLPE